MPNDFDRIESVAEFLAQEPAGDAVRVTDSAMEPVLFAGDLVWLENRSAADAEVACLDLGGVYVFGYREGRRCADQTRLSRGSNSLFRGSNTLFRGSNTLIHWIRHVALRIRHVAL